MSNECIPLYRPGGDLTGTADSAGVTGKTFVDVTKPLDAASGTNVTIATAKAAGLSLGVASRDAAAGIPVGIIANPGVIAPVTAGGTIAVGAEVEVGDGGKAVTLASGKARGRALSAGKSGDDVFIRLY